MDNKMLKPASEAEKKNALEKELGRYKKAFAARNIVIGQLKEENAGLLEVNKILGAYVLYLLPEDGEVKINKEEFKKFLTSKDIEIIVDETDTDYIITKKKIITEEECEEKNEECE